MIRTRTCLFALLSLALTTSAIAGTPVRASSGLLTGTDGKTLYTYDDDSPGHSVCTGPCEALWPPARADGTASGDFTTITRSDGSKQWAYRGKPLYFYVPDQKPGDALGNGVNGNWHVVK